MALRIEDRRIIEALVAVAWADGAFAAEEGIVLEGFLVAFGASAEEAEILRQWARTPRALDPTALVALADDDRRMLFSYGVELSWADGVQPPSEQALLAELAARLGIDTREAGELAAEAMLRARKHRSLR